MIENRNIAIVGWFRRTEDIANNLAKKNHVYRIHSGPEEKIICKDNMTTYIEKVKTRGKTFKFIKRCYKLKKNIDIFHIHDLEAGFYRFIDKKTPLIITFHGYLTLEKIANKSIKHKSIHFRFLRWFEKQLVKRADAVIGVDSTTKNFLINTLGADENKVFCIPNGVNIEAFSPDINGDHIRQKYLKPDDKLIVCIRDFKPKNGVFIVLKALNTLINEKKVKNIRVLLGGTGPLLNDFKEYIKKNKLQDHVYIINYVLPIDMPKYFAAADIIINTFTHIPYIDEEEVESMSDALNNEKPIATSRTTVEALATGKPTIVCTVGGKFNGIRSSEPGVLLPDNNSNLLAESIHKLLINEKLRKKIGNNGRKYIVNNRSWVKITERIEKVYQHFLNDRKRKK